MVSSFVYAIARAVSILAARTMKRSETTPRPSRVITVPRTTPKSASTS